MFIPMYYINAYSGKDLQLILNFGSRSSWMSSFTTWPPYRWLSSKIHWLGLRPDQDAREEKISRPLRESSQDSSNIQPGSFLIIVPNWLWYQSWREDDPIYVQDVTQILYILYHHSLNLKSQHCTVKTLHKWTIYNNMTYLNFHPRKLNALKLIPTNTMSLLKSYTQNKEVKC
jgi:hypothetical protein